MNEWLVVGAGGKLPMTWYPQEYLNNLPMTTMDMRPNPSKNYPGRTYRFYQGPVVYPFGHGLSYTTFNHTIAKAPKVFSVPMGRNSTKKLVRVAHASCKNLTLRVHVDVENTGSRDGTHTLLMFASPPAGIGAGGGGPQKQLVAFHTVGIPAGGKQRVALAVRVCKYLSVVDSGGVRRIPMGEHGLYIGDARHGVSLKPHDLRLIKS